MTSRSSPALAPVDALDEARNELALADHELDVLALAALELHPVDAADEIDGQAVAVARRSVGLDLVAVARSDQLAQRLVDGLVGHVGDLALELQGGEVGDRRSAAAPRRPS